MSYVTITSIDDARNLEGLAQLPQSTVWRLLKSKTHGRLFFDPGFDPTSEWQVDNFTSKPNYSESHAWEPASFKLGGDHQHLDALAQNRGMAEQMARPMIKFALLLSRLSEGRVFSGIADSQGHDAVCLAERGRVLDVKFCYGEEIITIDSVGAISKAPNVYCSEEEGTLEGGLLLDESERHFGYRLSWLNDLGFPEPDPDEYEIVARSDQQVRPRGSVAMSLLRLLWRGPF